MVGALSSFLVAALSQGLQAPLDLSLTHRVGPIMQEVSRQTGQSFTIDQELENEVLAVHVAQVPAKELMEWVAQALDATWSETENGHRLYVSLNQRREQERIEQERILSGLTQSWVSVEQALEQPPMNANRARDLVQDELDRRTEMEAWYRENPESIRSSHSSSRMVDAAQRVIARTLAPELLIDLQPGERRVYAITPNRLQDTLPGMREAAQLWLNEFNVLLEEGQHVADSMEESVSGGVPLGMSPVSGVSEMHIAVSRDDNGHGFEASVAIFGEGGELLDVANQNFFSTPIPEIMQPSERYPLELEPETLRFIEEDALRIVDYAPYESKEDENAGYRSTVSSRSQGRRIYSWLRNRSNSVVVSEEGPHVWSLDDLNAPPLVQNQGWRQRIGSPLEVEPLGLFVGPAYLRWAEEQSKNLVVPLSDHAFIEFLKLSTEESWYPKTILENTGVTVEETEEWTAGKIKSPLSTRQSRMDRSAAEDFLQIVLNRGFASDPEALRFAPHMGTFPRVGSLGEVLTLLLQPTSARFLIRAKPSDQSIYEALLTIDRSDTTSFPEPKPLEGFSPTVQNAVREYLTRSRARTRSSRTFTHVMEEPTEFLAGPNPPILIRVYSLSRDAYVAHNPETLFSDVVTPWVLSLSMGQGDRFKANPTHFSPARERTVGIIIYMADQPISNSLNIELESARDGNTITREQLFEKHTDLFGRM